jgi:protein SCO1/2
MTRDAMIQKDGMIQKIGSFYCLAAALIILVFACLNGAAQVNGAGGDFTLTDHEGRSFNLSQLRGRVVLLYFGYTSCTEACPLMFSKVSAAYRLLGEDKEKVSVLLVTVDPERDTREKLKQYLHYFKLNATGLTGEREEIDAVTNRYGAKYEIEKSNSALGYHVNHTTDLFLIDQSGKLRHRIKHDDSPAAMAYMVRQLLR